MLLYVVGVRNLSCVTAAKLSVHFNPQFKSTPHTEWDTSARISSGTREILQIHVFWTHFTSVISVGGQRSEGGMCAVCCPLCHHHSGVCVLDRSCRAPCRGISGARHCRTSRTFPFLQNVWRRSSCTEGWKPEKITVEERKLSGGTRARE
ncbi:hypothetical protein XENOCAPTIV_027050 [Xenoophorus captivus]|uniref:Secreted protein n=1 Tax=Xenoophorus captivus TaxID=1517983 RepID=A0ABV0RKA2_9TELE